MEWSEVKFTSTLSKSNRKVDKICICKIEEKNVLCKANHFENSETREQTW